MTVGYQNVSCKFESPGALAIWRELEGLWRFCKNLRTFLEKCFNDKTNGMRKCSPRALSNESLCTNSLAFLEILCVPGSIGKRNNH
jgi:hypothetical protein